MIRCAGALRMLFAVSAVFAALGLAGAVRMAQAASSPFGVGLPEPASLPSGWFSGFLAWVAVHQSVFYRSLSDALKATKADGSALWWLAGLSFAYGVFHAVGPGHGKAVISSYVLASAQTARKAVVLSFAAAMAQATVAVVLISIAAAALNLTAIAITRTTAIFEIGSYALVTALGAWLVWRKVLWPMTAGEATGRDHHAREHGHAHARHRGTRVCAHAHAPEPAMLREPLSWGRFWSIIAAVGFRPCTGALIVLVFALSQQLFVAGIAATFVMAIGTGITVGALSVFAVTARELAMRVAGPESRVAHYLHRGIEIAGAVAVFLLGLILLSATLGWG